MTRKNEWGSRKAPGLSLVASVVERWRDLPDGPEKYNAYLCSREWNVKKEAVHERSGGWCERCRVNRAEQVHHLTYSRKFSEPLEDLLHLCRGCHKFISGKSDEDPRPRRKIYLAGKVSKRCWRHKIVRDLRSADWENAPLRSAVCVNGEAFDYVGPFFVSCDHGCYHGDGTHGCLGDNQVEEVEGELIEQPWASVCGSGNASDILGNQNWNGDFLERNDLIDNHGCRLGSDGEVLVIRKCVEAIRLADVVMAWIDRPDCFGTLYELGVASANAELWIGFASDALRSDMWFVAHSADRFCVAGSACDAIATLQARSTHA